MEENAQKAVVILDKVIIAYKRILLIAPILILLIIVFFETTTVVKTIKAKNYIETTATYVNKSNNEDDSELFDDYIYSFEDIKGTRQEITISIPQEEQPPKEIKIKYDNTNTKKYYKKTQIFSSFEMLFYVIKVIILLVLTIIFFNKNLLRKTSIRQD